MSEIIRPIKPKALIDPQGNKVVPLPIRQEEGGAWKTSLDCLKALVADIENGRLVEPDTIYVAMRHVHPENPTRVAYPGYFHSTDPNVLALLGLLERHKLNLASR